MLIHKMSKTWTKRPSLLECKQGHLSEFSFFLAAFMGFWLGKGPSLWSHFLWINRVLSPLQLCRRKLSKNTPPTLDSGPIFSSRSSCQFPEKSSKSPSFSSCFLLHVFSKIQPRCPRFLMISKVDLPDIIYQLFLFGLWFP